MEIPDVGKLCNGDMVVLSLECWDEDYSAIHDMILNRGATALIAIGAGKIKQGRSNEVGEIRLDEFIQNLKVTRQEAVLHKLAYDQDAAIGRASRGHFWR